MKTTSVAVLKKHLSAYILMAEKGEPIEVRKRNVPVAHLIGITAARRNRTKLGCGKGTGRILGDLTGPLMPPEHWEMLKNGNA